MDFRPAQNDIANLQEVVLLVERCRSFNIQISKKFESQLKLRACSCDLTRHNEGYSLYEVDKALSELHRQIILKDYLKSRKLQKKVFPPKVRRRNKNRKIVYKKGVSKDDVCLYCNLKGHWKESCKEFLSDRKNGLTATPTSGMYVIEVCTTSYSTSWVLVTGCGSHIFVICRNCR